MEMRELLVFSAVYYQSITRQVILGYQALRGSHKVPKERIIGIQVRKSADVFFRNEQYMKWMDRLRMPEDQQGIRLTQTPGRDEK